jgi:DNA polymerase-3 subunit delta'
LVGPRGIGKRGLAFALAGRLLSAGKSRVIVLDAKTARAAGRAPQGPSDHHPDLHVLAPATDKNSISVDQVRDTIAALELTSLAGNGKVLIVEPAESMTLAAANALLKTLEEPTPDTYFLLVSHQPGLLPTTVRSRCQLARLGLPSKSQALDWLAEAVDSDDRAQLESLLALGGGAPVRALELYEAGIFKINNELEDMFNDISNSRVDPLELADQWQKADADLYLSWLAGRLERVIKLRLAPDASTAVTDPARDTLHNAWRSLTLKALFDRLGETRELLAQLGGGVNVELALRVLLLGFRPGSSRS